MGEMIVQRFWIVLERIVDANISCGTEVYLWQGLLVQRHIDALLNKFMNDMCTS